MLTQDGDTQQKLCFVRAMMSQAIGFGLLFSAAVHAEQVPPDFLLDAHGPMLIEQDQLLAVIG